jgi:hypothetical protein
MQGYRYPPLAPGAGDKALEEILRHIAVPKGVLDEAKRRRNLVCELAMRHPAARDTWYSGSIAHGTHNSPLGDADCGVMVDRRSLEFRAYGPDTDGVGLGPEMFIQSFAEVILPEVRAAGYPGADVDLSGNRAIKFNFNERVDFGEFGAVDPYVDLIVGLDRRDGDSEPAHERMGRRASTEAHGTHDRGRPTRTCRPSRPSHPPGEAGHKARWP